MNQKPRRGERLQPGAAWPRVNIGVGTRPEGARPSAGGVRLIPDITFVIRQVVFLQQIPVLFLETDFAVMFGLSGDVFLHRVTMRRADGKHSVTGLPVKVVVPRMTRLQPNRRRSFDFPYQIRRRTGARMGDKEVDVVGDRTDFEKDAVMIGDDAADVSVKRIPVDVIQARLAVLGREDQVNQDLGERLRHSTWLRPVGARNCFDGHYRGCTPAFNLSPLRGFVVTKCRSMFCDPLFASPEGAKGRSLGSTGPGEMMYSASADEATYPASPEGANGYSPGPHGPGKSWKNQGALKGRDR